MTRSGRPTLADVARQAGVSLKTASRAVNHEYGVAATTSERVLQASRDLGFRPNHVARTLASGRPASAVGLILPGVADPFLAALAGAVEDVLAPRGLQLVTASHGDDPERQHVIVRTLVERRVDALLVVPAPGSAAYLQAELDHGLVVVALDRPLDGIEVDTVTVDNEAGAARLVDGLLVAGHRRIALVADDERLWTMQARTRGYRRALAREGIGYDPALVDLHCHDMAGAEAATLRLLDLSDPPTAVFTAQNLAGRGVLRAIRRTGVRLDLAMVDEMFDTDLLLTPPVMLFASGPQRLGRAAGAMVLERLDGLTAPPRSLVLQPEIRVAMPRRVAPTGHAGQQSAEATR